jgi:hypothetical protein
MKSSATRLWSRALLFLVGSVATVVTFKYAVPTSDAFYEAGVMGALFAFLAGTWAEILLSDFASRYGTGFGVPTIASFSREVMGSLYRLARTARFA